MVSGIRAARSRAGTTDERVPPPVPSLTERDIADDAGIPSAEAARRLAHEGANEVRERRTPSWVAFASWFWSPSAWLLEAVALLFVRCIG
jgi:hypothetical protein